MICLVKKQRRALSSFGRKYRIGKYLSRFLYPDKSLIVWSLSEDRSAGDTTVVGRPLRALRGHGHYVSDIALSSDGKYALSGSWDKFLRLWDLTTGRSTRRFGSHTGDVLSVSFSADNRQIVSGSRDRTIKLWNTLAQCKHTIIVIAV